MSFPVWRYKASGEGCIVRDEAEDDAAREAGFLPADVAFRPVEEEEADPIPDVEIDEAPKRRGRPRKS